MVIGIIGAGSWGTALAIIASNNTDVILYTRDEDRAKEMNSYRINERYLPEIELSSNITVTSKIEEVENISHLVIAVPSIAFRETVEKFSYLNPDVPYVSVTKGLEQKSNLRMTQVILDADSRKKPQKLAVLGGPNLAREIAHGEPAATVVASEATDLAQEIQEKFLTSKFRAYVTDDVIGCEIAGVAKNVVAIAVGIGDGLGYGDNAKAAVMTRGLAEISRLGEAEGGKKETFAGLAGLGDLIATSSSLLSKNRTVGFHLGQGKTIKKIKTMSTDVAEGIYSVEALISLAQKHNIEMPIAQGILKIVQDGKLSSDAVEQLMTRPAGRE